MNRLIFLLLTVTLFLIAKPTITVYNAYANGAKVYINGRLIKEHIYDANSSDGAVKNIINKARLLLHNDLENIPIYALIKGKLYSVKSDNEGYFSFSIKQHAKKAVLFLKQEQEAKEVKILSFNKPQIGVISDFDDTLVLSNVLHKVKLLREILAKNYKQRVVIKKSASIVKKILKKHQKAPFVVVSGSPYELYFPIKNFLAYHNFTKPIILLKQLTGSQKEPLDQYKYKVAKISKIFLQFPNTKWYLLGDSGEKDKEVYNYFKKRYPRRVIAIYIRDVNSKP